MASYHSTELDSGAADSVTSSPRSDNLPPSQQRQNDELHPRVRFMCSFGGRILPRPHDNQLRYVGGDTRIVAVHRTTRFSPPLAKLSKLSGSSEITIKYQLPNEELDALITVTTDEDVENMMEEYDRLNQGSNSKTARLRLFLFPVSDSDASSLSSIMDGQSKRVREHWFFDALNGGRSISAAPSLERGRSEVSSIISEVPDYLFGFDNSDDLKPKTRPVLADNVSFSDPGSPAPAASSPYGSTSSQPCVPSIPDLPPLKTKLEDPNLVSDSKESQIDGDQSVSRQTEYTDNNTTWQYYTASHFSTPAVQPMHVYYVPGPVPAGKVPTAAVPVPATYVQRIPMGFAHPVHGVGQVYAGPRGVKAVTGMEAYEYATAGVAPEVLSQQQAYHAARNPGVIPSYPASVAATVVPSGAAELQAVGTEMKIGRVSQP